MGYGSPFASCVVAAVAGSTFGITPPTHQPPRSSPHDHLFLTFTLLLTRHHDLERSTPGQSIVASSSSSSRVIHPSLLHELVATDRRPPIFTATEQSRILLAHS